MRLWQSLLALVLILSGGLGLLLMSGHARDLMAPDLRAELRVNDFPLPPDMGVDPTHVAEFLSAELQDRMEGDVAIRLMMEEDTAERVRTIVLPRLMSAVAVQAMMREVPELSALLDMGDFRRTVSGTVTTDTLAEDVALTVPGALLATVDGVRTEITIASTGMPVLELGTMESGQEHVVRLWLDDSAAEADLARMILLGADEGQRGRVLLWGENGWFGADVETLRWGRWLIGGVLASVLLFGLANIFVPVLGVRRNRGMDGSVPYGS